MFSSVGANLKLIENSVSIEKLKEYSKEGGLSGRLVYSKMKSRTKFNQVK